jgi:hypothetical protein
LKPLFAHTALVKSMKLGRFEGRHGDVWRLLHNGESESPWERATQRHADRRGFRGVHRMLTEDLGISRARIDIEFVERIDRVGGGAKKIVG